MKCALFFALVVASARAQFEASNRTIQIADRGDLGLFNALSTEAPPSSLFAYTDAQSRLLPPRFMASGLVGNVPIPTNNWWGNMIAASRDAQAQPIWANPYTLRPSLTAAPFGLTVSYPYSTRAFGGSSGNSNANKFYLHSVINDMTFSATEFGAAPTYEVFKWDDLSVSARFFRNNPSTKVEFTLVSGMAFVTGIYQGLTPRFVSAHEIMTVNGQSAQPGSVFSGSRFIVDLNNGQKWVMYTADTISLTMDGSSAMTARSPYSGYFRLALVTNDAQLAALDQTKLCLIEGANVEAKDTNTYAFLMKTSGDCSGGLFHYLQIHHIDNLDRSTASEVAGAQTYSTTRGPMTGVVTKTSPPAIRFRDTQNVPADFYPPRKPSAEDVRAQRLKEVLVADLNSQWSIPLDGSYYFNGKAAQKYASLCLIANDATVTGGDQSRLLRQCLDKLELLLVPFIENKWKYPLQYDTVYRGILSSQGFATNDVNVDFGNTMYNDHHYHYGYWITTAAIVNSLDPTWSRLADLNRVVTLLIRDVGNPSNDDSHFPKFRQFDWFRGHSYSHGVTPFADGKDQESTSEEVNYHYGVTLFGKVTNNVELMTIGQLMLQLNSRAINTYFLMRNDNRAQPSQIVPNKVTGILFDNKADYATWFSPEKYALHGIQMIPISPVTEFVRTREFVAQEWDQILSKIPDVINTNVNNAWLSLLYANYATVNKGLAMQKLQQVAMDDGLTRSWALYMAATRP